MIMSVPENRKPVLNEVFADNGAHSHWELIDSVNGKILWTESSDQIPQQSNDEDEELWEEVIAKSAQIEYFENAELDSMANEVRLELKSLFHITRKISKPNE